MSSFNSVLGYSVAVGDFNEDGEDGKILIFHFFFSILLYFTVFLIKFEPW